ncbi:phytanoyl-CoA dioxygenase family protein [Azohydromonas lata]|uniref:phytanoyl-CoA dioxygenase family protein n=1 Tax=Azohydromonas lata TaxID=45677 RepID=UPI00082CDCD7|nr:phytanoyl-CoA dioxygenase family protein [Azohydromonas lata]
MYSQQEIDELKLQYETQGFIHLKGAIPLDMLQRLRTAFDAASERHFEQWQNDVKAGTGEYRFFDIPSILDQDPVFIDLVDMSTIFGLLVDIVGEDIQLNHTHARLFYPGPTFTPPWHSDIPHVLGVNHAHTNNLLIKVHFYIEDLSPEQGCLAFIPGSHRYPPRHIKPTITDIDKSTAAVKIVPKAGDAVLFNTHVLHMALDNSTDKVRKSLIYAYAHFWMKHYANAVPSDLQRFANTPQRQQLFGVDMEGIPYFNRRLMDNVPPAWHSTLLAASKRLVKRVLARNSMFG